MLVPDTCSAVNRRWRCTPSRSIRSPIVPSLKMVATGISRGWLARLVRFLAGRHRHSFEASGERQMALIGRIFIDIFAFFVACMAAAAVLAIGFLWPDLGDVSITGDRSIVALLIGVSSIALAGSAMGPAFVLIAVAEGFGIRSVLFYASRGQPSRSFSITALVSAPASATVAGDRGLFRARTGDHGGGRHCSGFGLLDHRRTAGRCVAVFRALRKEAWSKDEASGVNEEFGSGIIRVEPFVHAIACFRGHCPRTARRRQ